MGFKGTPETERAIEQTVDALLACPKSREDNLIRKLRSLWNHRLAEIAGVEATPLAALRAEIANQNAASTPLTPTTGPTLVIAASSTVPTELDTATTSTAAATNTAAREPTSHCEESKHE